MKKIFLTASFADVAEHFKQFIQSNSGASVAGKSVAFIDTASQVEAYQGYVDDNKKAFADLGIQVDVFDVSNQSAAYILAKIQAHDYLYIEGGNTFYLLQQLKATGADQIIVEQVQNGKVYIGCSAGTVILAPNIQYIAQMDDASQAPLLKQYNALNLIDFFPLPHYGDAPFQQAAEQIFQQYRYQYPLLTLGNDQFVAIYED